MTMYQKMQLVVACLVFFIIFDLIFPGYLLKNAYLNHFKQFGRATSDAFNILLPASLWAWLWMAIGYVIFAVPLIQQTSGWLSAAGIGALYGYTMFAVYNFTNWGTLAGWNVSLVMMDMSCGTISNAILGILLWYYLH